eukprot:167150-Pyramimonas_sp.AAC.1
MEQPASNNCARARDVLREVVDPDATRHVRICCGKALQDIEFRTSTQTSAIAKPLGDTMTRLKHRRARTHLRNVTWCEAHL